MILAEKNGFKRQFTPLQWEVMGSDKMGWVVVPNEVITDVDKTPIVAAPSIHSEGNSMQPSSPKRRKK